MKVEFAHSHLARARLRGVTTSRWLDGALASRRDFLAPPAVDARGRHAFGPIEPHPDELGNGSTTTWKILAGQRGVPNCGRTSRCTNPDKPTQILMRQIAATVPAEARES